MVGQSLRDRCREVERLKECLAVAKTALDAANGVTVDARATKAVPRTELASELIFFCFFRGIDFVLILTPRISQRYGSSWAPSWLRRWVSTRPTRSWSVGWWRRLIYVISHWIGRVAVPPWRRLMATTVRRWRRWWKPSSSWCNRWGWVFTSRPLAYQHESRM
jgi:hypothetical protein